MSKKHPISSDKKANPALQDELGTLRGGIVGQAEKNPLPSRFVVTPHPDRPSMVITDQETGNTTTVPLFAYGEVRKALYELFPQS